jgi:hypothetical protein
MKKGPIKKNTKGQQQKEKEKKSCLWYYVG